MPLTLDQLINRAEHAMGGQADPRVDMRQLVNDAGESLCTLHAWSWLDRQVETLTVASGQSHADLPADFRRIICVDRDPNFIRAARLVTLSEIQHIRGGFTSAVLDRYMALEGDIDAPSGFRMAIYPAAESSDDLTLRLIYGGGWMPLNELDDVAKVPRQVENLLITLVQVHANAVERHDQPEYLGATLAAIADSPQVRRLREQSGMAQGNLGQMEGGAAETSSTGYGRQRYYHDDIIFPS